jgi:hypothetical protein
VLNKNGLARRAFPPHGKVRCASFTWPSPVLVGQPLLGGSSFCAPLMLYPTADIAPILLLSHTLRRALTVSTTTFPSQSVAATLLVVRWSPSRSFNLNLVNQTCLGYRYGGCRYNFQVACEKPDQRHSTSDYLPPAESQEVFIYL